MHKRHPPPTASCVRFTTKTILQKCSQDWSKLNCLSLIRSIAPEAHNWTLTKRFLFLLCKIEDSIVETVNSVVDKGKLSLLKFLSNTLYNYAGMIVFKKQNRKGRSIQKKVFYLFLAFFGLGVTLHYNIRFF